MSNLKTLCDSINEAYDTGKEATFTYLSNLYTFSPSGLIQFLNSNPVYPVDRDINRTGVDSQANCIAYWTSDVRGSHSSGVNLAKIDIESDQVVVPTTVNGFKINHNFGGGLTEGSRQTFSSVLNMTGQNADSSQNRFYVSANFTAQAAVNVHGTALDPKGHLFGFNPDVRIISGATYWDQVCGGEINVAAYTGSSLAEKIGLQIVKTSLDAVKGTRVNSAFVIGDQLPATTTNAGWDIGISFGTYQGYNSVDANGTLIGADPHANDVSAGTVALGIDWSLFTFTTAFLKSVGFLVDGLGNLISRTLGITPITVPSSPASGWTIYCDSGDGNKLKAKASNGTIITIGTP